MEHLCVWFIATRVEQLNSLPTACWKAVELLHSGELLQQLTIQDCNLTVVLPSSWGSSFAFPQLQQLTVIKHGGQSAQSASAYSNNTLIGQSQPLPA